MRRTALPAAVLPAAFLLALESVTAVPVEPSTARVSVSGADTNSCARAARCTVTSRAVEESGVAHARSSITRRSSTAASESAFGHAGHRLSVEVPAGSRRARATFVWRVSSAQASVLARTGRAFGQVGLATWAPWCQEGCAADEDRVTVLTVDSAGPRASRRSRGSVEVRLVATVSGRLPVALTWQSYAFAVVGGEAADDQGFAGRGRASITATLVNADVDFS